MGVKIRVTGDLIRPKERSLIIMNHRTRLDWMFFWSVVLRESSLSAEKIVLKSPLKRIPGAGFCKQKLIFFFNANKPSCSSYFN